MSAVRAYILKELEVIEKECMEKGISATEWVEKNAKNFYKKYWDIKPREAVVESYFRYKEKERGHR